MFYCLSKWVTIHYLIKALDDVLFCNRDRVVVKVSAIRQDVICSLVKWLFESDRLKLELLAYPLKPLIIYGLVELVRKSCTGR
jgi:hypothetical protein